MQSAQTLHANLTIHPRGRERDVYPYTQLNVFSSVNGIPVDFFIGQTSFSQSLPS
jgi:hypothetical protein